MTVPDSTSGTTRGSDPALDLLVERLTDALLAGEQVDVEAVIVEHPEHAEQLRSIFPALELMAALRRSAGGEDGGPSTNGHEQPLEAGSLGDYRIVRELGRGGMGVVYEAVQISLNRRVALKVLPFAAALDPRQRQRFQVEAQAAAHLHHNHIVPIFSTGCERGLHFYAMQFIEGRSLAEMIRELKRLGRDAGVGNGGGAGPIPTRSHIPELAAAPDTPGAEAEARESRSAGQVGTLSSRSGSASSIDFPKSSSSTATKTFFRTVAQMGVQAAEALEHAHSLGVLHRDIKPANLLVEPQGNLWVTDFGLARFQAEAGITMTGDLLGTLRYMSPEQALGKRVVVDHRTDVYALGATLYELIALHPAFDGRNREDLMRQITFEEPRPPRHFNSALPRDLETIVLKAMAKEPESRYSSAQEMADDLTLFLDDKPIRARRPTPLEQAAKWSRRHRAVVGTACGVLLLAAGVGAALLWNAKQETQAALWALQQTRRNQREAMVIAFDTADRMTMAAMTELTAALLKKGKSAPREFYGAARDFYRKMAKVASEEPELLGMEAEAYHRLAFTHMVLGEPQAEESYRKSLALFERLMKRSPQEPEPRRQMATTLVDFGYLLWYNGPANLKDAEPLYRRALGLRHDLVAEFPDNYVYLQEFAESALDFSNKLQAEKRAADAQGVRRQVLDLFAKRVQDVPEATDRQMELVLAHHKLAAMLLGFGHRREAEHILRQALELDPNNPGTYSKLAALLAGPPDQAPHDPSQAVALAKKAVALAPRTRDGWNALGLAYFRARKWNDALAALDHSMSLSNGGNGTDWVILAMIRWNLGERAEAKRWLRQSQKWIESHKSDDIDIQLVQHRTEAEGLINPPAAAPTETHPADASEEEEDDPDESSPSASAEPAGTPQIKPASTPTECMKAAISPRV